MSNSVPNSSPEEQKRRSSRIEQAVPLTVAGVDALGRPFQERTSTLIVNCHGCRYQSKHYVLKNMWVTLAVPHPEPDREPRSVRARVMWIRRPHTVRELFQIGVELEAAGNLWGIAFPPPDWFSFPDASSASAPSLVSEIPLPPVEEMPPEAPLAAVPEEDRAEEDNLRTMPLGGNEPSLLLARQMSRMVNEARQQLQAVIRESAAQAVSSEARPLIAALQRQLHEAARQSVEAAAEQVVQESAQKTAQAGESRLEQLREFWNRQLDESVEQAHQIWNARLEDTVRQFRGSFAHDLQEQSQQAIRNLDQAARDFEDQLNRAQENLTRLGQTTETAAAPFLADIEQRLRAQAEGVRAQLDQMDQASRRWQEEMNSAAAATQAAWQARLESDIQGAQERWDRQTAASLDSAVQQAAERLVLRSQDTAAQMERETGLRIAAMGRGLLDAGTDAEQRMSALRSSFAAQAAHAQNLLSQAEAAAREIEEQTDQLHALEQTMLVEMERHAGALLEAQAQKLDERARTALENWTVQLEPAMENASRQVVARLGAELEQQFGAQLEKVGQSLGELQSRTQIAVRAVDQHGESIRALSEETVKAAVERLEGSVARIEQDLQESSRAAAAKWIAEIEAKGTETTHTSFESLFKTADWYEKKVQTQMHNTLEKGIEQANVALRDKAGEISRLFAAEMDHYSRSYVEHTHGRIEEAGREALAGVQKQTADLSASATRAIAQQAQNQTDAALQQFGGKAAGVLGQISAQFEALTGQARAKFEADSQQSQAQFRAALGQHVQEAVRASRQEFGTELESAKEMLRTEGRRETAQLQQNLASLQDQGVESYRRRLEAASETSLLTAAAKLNQHSAQHLEALARSVEARLRDTCTQVFSSVGESLRRRLMDLALQPFAEKSAEKAPETPSDKPSPAPNQASK